MSPKLFDRQYLGNEFEKLNKALKKHVNLYLIGGGSMSFQKYKAATKDIDIVVRSNNELHQIQAALRSIGYIVPAVRGPYKKMEASAILENHDGVRWDVFVNVICGGLQLSEGMIKRSQELFKMQNISVYMISPEDIFVFKSITERERDREDMYTLFSKILDFDIIKKEFFWQNEHRLNDYEWMSFFFNGLEEFFDKYHISHPIIKELHDIAEKDTFIGIIKNRLRTKPMKIDELSADLDPEDVKAIVGSLLEQGYVIQNEQGQFLLTEDKS